MSTKPQDPKPAVPEEKKATDPPKAQPTTSPMSLPQIQKLKYIRKRIQPAAKEIFDKIVFMDSPEEMAKRNTDLSRLKADEEALKRKKEEEEAAAKKKREDEESATKKKAADDEAAKKKAADDAAAKKKKEDEEAAAKKKKEEDEAAAKKKKEEEDAAAKKKAADDEAAKKKASEDEAAKKKKEEEDAAALAANKKKAEEDAAAAAAKKKKDEEEAAAKKKADEEAEAKRKLDEAEAAEAARKAEELAAAKRLAEEQKRIEDAKYKPPKYKSDPEFNRAESSFAKYKLPKSEDYAKMLDADFKNSKLEKFFPTPEDMDKAKEFLLKEYFYFRLVHIFRHYQSLSNFPKVGFNDLKNMFKETKAFDDNFELSQLDIIYQEANAGANNKDKELERFEFMELIVRVAICKYKKTGVVQRHRDAIKKFLDEDFLPMAKTSEYEYNGLRFEQIQTSAVDKVLKKNKDKVDKLFLDVGGKDGSLDIKEVTKMIRDAKLSEVSNREAIWCFSMSQEAVIDEKKGGYAQMNKYEFREFLCRIAIKQYEKKPQPMDVMVGDLLKILIKK